MKVRLDPKTKHRRLEQIGRIDAAMKELQAAIRDYDGNAVKWRVSWPIETNDNCRFALIGTMQ